MGTFETYPAYRVWVDEDLCSGCGKCVEAVPDVFTHVNGITHVMTEEGEIANSCESVLVPYKLTYPVIDAANACPGEIIMVELVDEPIVPDPMGDFT